MANEYSYWNSEASSAREVRSSFDKTALRAVQDQMDAMRRSMHQSMLASSPSFFGYDAVADAIKETQKQKQNKLLLLVKL